MGGSTTSSTRSRRAAATGKTTRQIWAIHCRVISHSPDQLADAHDRAFINPATRFARLAFHFRDGTVSEPIREWYELEADYFRDKMRG